MTDEEKKGNETFFKDLEKASNQKQPLESKTGPKKTSESTSTQKQELQQQLPIKEKQAQDLEADKIAKQEVPPEPKLNLEMKQTSEPEQAQESKPKKKEAPKKHRLKFVNKEDDLNIEPFKMLSSPTTDVIGVVVNSSDHLNKLNTYSYLANTQNIKVETNGSVMKITSESKQNTTVIEIPNFEKFTRKNASAKLFYRYILTKLTQPCFFETKESNLLQKKYIRFNLQELVNLGAYSRKDTAKRAWLSAKPFLQILNITGEVYSRTSIGKKSILPESSDTVTFFDRLTLNKNNEVEIALNDFIDWEQIPRFYTLLPPYVFDSNNSEKAQDLATLIYQRARQSTKQIKDKGYFTISNQHISNILNLPLTNETGHPDRDIKQALLSPVEEINRLDSNLKLVDEYDKNGSIQEFLQGTLYIYIPSKLDTLKNETNPVLLYFTDRALSQEQEIQKAIDKKDKILSKAIAKAIESKTSKKE